MPAEARVAIVTGGATGVGAATALELAGRGYRVAINFSRSKTEADASVTECRRAGADVIAVQGDVADDAACRAVVAAAIARFGRLDVVVNNAGLMTFHPLGSLTLEDWQRVLDVDLLGAFYFIKYGFPVMKPGSAVVNIASIHAIQTSPLDAPYAAAKAALLSLTRSAAIEGKGHGIRVNAILPGAIDTPMLWDNPNVKSGAEQVDPSFVGKAQDVAAAIAFLASDDAAFIQGTTLVVDGGRLARL